MPASAKLMLQVELLLLVDKLCVSYVRLCARGESFSSSVPHKDVLETEVEKVPENKPSNDLSTKEEMVEASDGSQISDKESQRTSVGRPMRRSTAKVQSYKEKPLNVKMRRPG